MRRKRINTGKQKSRERERDSGGEKVGGRRRRGRKLMEENERRKQKILE